MAGTRRTDLLGRIADMSEDAIQRLSDAPGADRVLGALNMLRDRTDELQKRVRGLENLEQRLECVEDDAEEHEGHEHEELGRDRSEEELNGGSPRRMRDHDQE